MVRIVGVSEQIRKTVPNIPSAYSQARSARRRNASEYAGLRKGDGWKRKPEDQLLLEAVTRLGAISARQAQRHIYHLGYQAVRKRLYRMIDAGLLERMDTLPWAGLVVWPTVAGRRAAFPEKDHPLRQMDTPADSTMLHRLVVSEYALMYITTGRSIITEREARLFETGTALTQEEQRARFLEQAGVQRSINGSRGVVPTIDTHRNHTVERWLTLPLFDGKTSYRIPDFLVVTKHGELRCIEIEITPKTTTRLRPILTGYRRACLAHEPIPTGIEMNLHDATRKPGQFANVQWLATDPVITQLRGHTNGINPITGKPDKGLIREIWDADPSTRLFFQHNTTWELSSTGWPISVRPLNFTKDPGIEYALSQRILPPNYRTSLSTWKKWRKLWELDMQGETNPVPYTQWLRMPGILTTCKKHTH